MSILNCTTLAATCLSLSLTLLTSQIASAQTQNLVIDDEFDAAFLILSSVDTVASHQVSGLSFGQTNASLNSNFDFFTDLKLTTSVERSPSNSYDINFLLTTGSYSGFVPPGTTIGLEPVKEWRLDISDFFSGSDNGIDFPTPVTYNSALGSWYDDGFLVFQTSYLPQLNDGSNPTQLAGQFEIGLRSGDLGSIGNGIDTFSLTVNVTPILQTTQAIPEYSSISALLIYTSLGLASAYRLRNQKSLFKQN